ncbi:serine/arginine repetitive matrix protein 2-like isoform X2 [Saccostrea cucullata]|uniref:serine/arginine repetitive matrix protein 2-like isoform X2 n=1 Tax=Saccostrea cuccullata TaxID=36930 RepID=UPI002ED3C305
MENKRSQRSPISHGFDIEINSIQLKPSRVAEIAKRLKSAKENINSTASNSRSRDCCNSAKGSMRTPPVSRPSSQMSGNDFLVSGKEDKKESPGKDDVKQSSSVVRKTGEMAMASPSPEPKISRSFLSQSSVISRNGSGKSNRHVCSAKKDLIVQTSPRNGGESYRSASNLSGFDSQCESKTPESGPYTDRRRTPAKESISRNNTSDCVSHAGRKTPGCRNYDQSAEKNAANCKHSGRVEDPPHEIKRASNSPTEDEYQYEDDFEEEDSEKKRKRKKTVLSTKSEDDFWNTGVDDEKPNRRLPLKLNLATFAFDDSKEKLKQACHKTLEPKGISQKQSGVNHVFAGNVGLKSETRNESSTSLSCDRKAGSHSRTSSRQSRSKSRSLYNDCRPGSRAHDRELHYESRLSFYSSHSDFITPGNDAHADSKSPGLGQGAADKRTPDTDSRSGSRTSDRKVRTASRTPDRESYSRCSQPDHKTLASASVTGWKTLESDFRPRGKVPHTEALANHRTPLRDSFSASTSPDDGSTSPSDGSTSPDDSSRLGSGKVKNDHSSEKLNQSNEKLGRYTGNVETSSQEMERPNCSPKVVEYHYDDDFEETEDLEKEEKGKETVVSTESKDDFWNTGDDDTTKSKKLKEAVSREPKLAAFAPVKEMQKFDQTGNESLEPDCIKLRSSNMEKKSVSNHTETTSKSPASVRQTTTEACAKWVAKTSVLTIPKDPQDLSALIAEKILGDKTEFKITGKNIRKSRKTAPDMGKTKREPSKPPVKEKQKERKKAKRAKARLQDFTALEHRGTSDGKNDIEGMMITGTAKSSPYLNRQDHRMGKGTCSTSTGLPTVSNTLDDLKLSPYLKQGQRKPQADVALPRIEATRINPMVVEHHGDRKKSTNVISRQHRMIELEEEIGSNQWKPEVRKLPHRPRQINERTLRKLPCPPTHPTHPKAEATMYGDSLEVTVMDPCGQGYASDKNNIKITVMHHSNKIYKELPTHPPRNELYYEYSSDPDIIKHRAEGPPFVTYTGISLEKRRYSKR